jgi:GNAT superfamily N-acetyltransferase
VTVRVITVKDAADLTPEERRVCNAMSFKSNGDLASWLWDTKHGYDSGKVVLVREHDVVVGWAMRMDDGRVGFWTRTSHRRRGIGTQMVEEISKLGKIHTAPHDLKSAKLFLKTKSCPKGTVRMWRAHVKRIESGERY